MLPKRLLACSSLISNKSLPEPIAMNKILSSRFTPFVAALVLSSGFFPVSAVYAQQTAVSPSVAKTLTERLAAMEKEIEKQRTTLGIPGVALVVVQGDQILYIKGLGLRDVAQKKPVTPDTLFAIGSSSKAFTVASVLMSQDDGKLSLNDSPKKVLPYFKLQDPEADSKITIRDMMCHDSGLPRTDLAWISGKLTREEGIRLLGDVKPTAPFRQKFQYQNLMFSAAGEIASRVQKMPYEKLIETRLFQPLGMKNSNLRVKAMQQSKDFAIGYVPDPEHPGSKPLSIRDVEAVAPAGAINSSARDMALWLRFLISGGVAADGKRLLTEASFAEMIKPQMNIAPKTMDYGLGWFVRKWHGLTMLEHGGNIDGFNAQVSFLPEKKLGFVLLTNVTGSPLAQGSLDIVWSHLVDVPADSTPVKPTVDSGPTVAAKDEAGIYLLGPAKVTVAVAEDKLTLSVPGQPTYPLERLSGRRYKLAAPAPDGFFITFQPVKDKPAETEASLEQPNGTFLLKKEIAGSSASPKFDSPIPVDELLASMVKAAGGEAVLRRHTALVLKSRAVLENQGLVADIESVAEYPNRREQKVKFIALGKKVVGQTRDYFDGKGGGFQSDFGASSDYKGESLIDIGIQSSLQPILDARKIFSKIEIVGQKTQDGEDVLILQKTPTEGSTVTEYVSRKTFRVLRRDIMSAVSPAQGHTETYSDFRMIDGELMPFKTVTQTVALGTQVETIIEARFNAPIPKASFLSGKETARSAQK
jgi:CubicO group peptidase (beta-lactamase class C family)